MEKELRLRDPGIGNMSIIPPLEENNEIEEHDEQSMRSISPQIGLKNIDMDIEEPNESILDGFYIPEYNTIK